MKKLQKLTLKEFNNSGSVMSLIESQGIVGGGVLETAQGYLGICRVPGADANSDITMFLHSTSLSSQYANSDETAWCSAFVNYCVGENGYTGTNNALASSWSSFGSATNSPKVGDIAYRNGHCGIVSSVGSNGAFTMIAGNSGDDHCVAYESYGSSCGYSFRTY